MTNEESERLNVSFANLTIILVYYGKVAKPSENITNNKRQYYK